MNKRRRTFVRYWKFSPFKDTPWGNGEEIKYSDRFKVAKKVMDLGYNVMFLQGENEKEENTLILIIDNGRFR